MKTTISFAAEWDAIFGRRTFFGIDRRVTSSSRLPGKAIAGVVDHSGGSKLVHCEKCGRLRHDLGGPHSPQMHRDGRVTDCVGDEVRRG
jgi:hypothetical protein